jgi:hypothetical protein
MEVMLEQGLQNKTHKKFEMKNKRYIILQSMHRQYRSEMKRYQIHYIPHSVLRNTRYNIGTSGRVS